MRKSLVRLGASNIVVMRGHGSTVTAPSLHLAVFRAYYADVNARYQAQAIGMGLFTPAHRGRIRSLRQVGRESSSTTVGPVGCGSSRAKAMRLQASSGGAQAAACHRSTRSGQEPDCSGLSGSPQTPLDGPGVAAARAALDSAPKVRIADALFDPVITDPSKILCVGVNYATHLAESGIARPEKPMIFVRFANSQVGHRRPMLRPPESDKFDFEGELAVIIGKRARRVRRASPGICRRLRLLQ
jgi:Fumarylacetoacetate (FAA) hydrolase family